jgi:hypothetical protein
MVRFGDNVPVKTEGEELLHSLRNILFSLRCGIQQMADAHHARVGDEEDFDLAFEATKRQIEALAEAVRRVDRTFNGR